MSRTVKRLPATETDHERGTMTRRRWTAAVACAALAGLAGCATADESPRPAPSSEPAPTSEVAATADATAWPDPLPGPGPNIVAADYPALEEYDLTAYEYKRPLDPPNPAVDFSETVVWMAEGEGAQLADDFDTEPLDERLELLSEWPQSPPADLESSDALVEALRIGFEEEFTVAVSPGTDLLFIVSEGGDALPGGAESS